MTLLALDVGERRVGIAISESGIFATPHSVLHRKSKKEDFVRLQRLCTELGVERIIVGIPYSLNEDTPVGPQARRTKRYADALAKAIPLPIEYLDESYSTADAKEYLATTGKKNIPIDAAAAAVILQKYLDSKKSL